MDLLALRHTANEEGMPLKVLDAVSAVNAEQKHVLVDKVKAQFGDDLSGKVFALWGLAFKPRTDDMREAPSITIVNDLIEAGARVRGSDPVAMETAREEFGDRIEYFPDEYAALSGADGLLLLTEWNSYRSPDFERIAETLRTKAIFDGRNIWDRGYLERLGFTYHGIGV